MTPKVVYSAEQVEHLKMLGHQYPERAKMAKGQSPRSVFFQAPPDAPHNVDKLYEAGQLLRHPSGRFVRP